MKGFYSSTSNTAGLSMGVSRASSTNRVRFNEGGVEDNKEHVVFSNGEVLIPAMSAVVRRRSNLQQ